MADVKLALWSLFTIAVWFEQVTCDVTKGTELVFSFLVHRHGDRTPVESSVALSNDPDALEEYIKPYGYGQLTDEGKRTAYKIGLFIRSRYNDLLSPNYNRSDIYLRSTDSTRAKMTVLAAMAATYFPKGKKWNPLLNWTPVPYTTVPVKYDFNLAFLNCPTFLQQQSSAQYGFPPALVNYTDVLDSLSDILGYNVTSYIVLATGAYDVYLSQQSLGLPLSAAIKNIMPRLDEVAAIIWDYIYGNENYLRLEAGVLLNEFYKYAALAIAGEDTQKVRVYSAHDANVFAAIKTYNIPTQGVVRYGGTISLEVRKVIATGNYVVLPVYMKFPGQPVKYLQVTGCDQLCDLDQFISLTSQNALNETEWRTECQFYDTLSIDTSGID